MDLQTHFDVLSVVLERYESEGRTVRRVETESLAGAGLRATMDVTVPLEGAGGPTPSTTLSGDGTLRLMIPDAGLPTPPEDVAAAVTTAPNGARITDDGTVVVSVALAVDASEEAPGDDDVRSETGDPDANIRGDGAGVATDDDGDSTGLAAVRDESRLVKCLDGVSQRRRETREVAGDIPLGRPEFIGVGPFQQGGRGADVLNGSHAISPPSTSVHSCFGSVGPPAEQLSTGGRYPARERAPHCWQTTSVDRNSSVSWLVLMSL